MNTMYDDTVAVVENRPLTGGHFLLSLDAPRQARATRPGQFAMVRLLGRSDVLLRRPMSIYDIVPRSARPGKRGARELRPPHSVGDGAKTRGRAFFGSFLCTSKESHPGCRGGATRTYAVDSRPQAARLFKAWIPAFAGMTAWLDARLRGHDSGD